MTIPPQGLNLHCTARHIKNWA